jgi:hypothetical protein
MPVRTIGGPMGTTTPVDADFKIVKRRDTAR